MKKLNVLISGGTGLVGNAISKLLIEGSYEVAVLSRRKHVGGTNSFFWDYENDEIDPKAIEFADIIIHLAGENVSARRWSKDQKNKIISSRVQTTQLLKKAIQQSSKKPLAFISASATGYYGSLTSDHIFKEEDQSGNDFLAETVVKWEDSVQQISELGIPTASLRIGVVMSEKGGALPKMLLPVKFGLASALGHGKQWIPWISLSDLSRMFLFVLEQKLLKSTSSEFLVYNAVHPSSINNVQLMKRLAKAINRPYFMPAIPSFIFKLLFGEMSVILLEGSRVSSEKIISEGFEFKDKNIEDIFS